MTAGFVAAADFEETYRHFYEPIRQYILSKVWRHEIADELAQATFLKAFRNWDRFNPKYAMSTWLWTIARNTITDFFKRKDEQQMDSYDDERGYSVITCEDVMRDLIVPGYSSFTDRERQILVLCVICGYTHREAGALLGTSEQSVRQRLFRLRKKKEK